MVRSEAKPGGGTTWYVARPAGNFDLHTETWACPEFLWSPESAALAVTYSDGGLVGNYYISVYRVTELEPALIDVLAAVRSDFTSSYPKCYDTEEPNFGAVSWLDGSQHLLVAAEVLRHSNCDDAGTFALYEVSVPDGKIIKKYDQLEAKRLFADKLGSELSSANDDCIRKPGSCYIPELHKQDKPPH
ncbi:MAG TPA: hypothetical protein VGS99_06215 [Gammaproteobacteria bacterium]|nr:hypothetical protein [Gammaproteobacteria bacterium]